MAIYLTNGKCFIAHSGTGGIIKVNSMNKALDFGSVEKAMEQKKIAPGKTSGYYYIDSDSCGNKSKQTSKTSNIRRRNFSNKDRLSIYRKTKGHCYLCGEFVDFDVFEIEHREPLAKGGSNNFSNLYCSCHTCNSLKGSIAPDDLMEKIKQIHLYQIQKAHGNGLRWRIVYRALKRIL